MKLSALQWDTEMVQVKRGRVKNLYLRVKPPDGHIEVTAPLRVEDDLILDFINSRGPWIGKARNRLSAAMSSGLSQATQTWDADAIFQAKQRIRQQLPDLLQHWVPVVGRGPSSISLRLMTSRWGSCTPATRRIRLNLELARLDPKFLEYVLVHELTHLHVHGHGPEFQRRMNLYLPKWKVLRKELNTHMIV
jgi:predicted metal-dependent hydrolase